jgi:hypothetical protein
MTTTREVTQWHLNQTWNPYQTCWVLGRSARMERLSDELDQAGRHYISDVMYGRDTAQALANIERLRDEMYAEDRRCRGWQEEA